MRYRSFLCCAAVILSFASPAFPFCSVPQPRLVCAEYFRSQLVVKGTLVGTQALHDKGDPEGVSAYVHAVRVDQALRGTSPGTLFVYEGNDSGRATFDWISNKQYLLFLSRTSANQARELDGCGNSGPLDGAGTALSAIEAIKPLHTGLIRGVVSERALSSPIVGVHVEALGAGRRFAALTNQLGEFEFNVPPGRYSVRTVEKNRSFGIADISYRDLRYPIEAGGCAQVQLAENGGSPSR